LFPIIFGELGDPDVNEYCEMVGIKLED